MKRSPEEIATLVSRSLREELALYPKPGLVSPVDNGSHPDMNAACFEASIEAIEPFFAAMANAGSRHAPLVELQRIGIAAEAAMLEATTDRNTHRGAIFCLGLLAAAAGARADHEPLGEIVRARWGSEIPVPASLAPTSPGLAMCHRHRVNGVRGEAKHGFPLLFDLALPTWRKHLATHSREAAAVQTFFTLLPRCEDTTLLRRGGEEGRRFAHERADDFLASGGVATPDWREHAIAIHHEFVARNLTAGGVADLLAATLFVDYLDGP